jgi:cell division transport system permease protein
MSKQKKYRKKKKLGSYPIISVMFSMTIALFLLGLFATLFSTTNALTNIIQRSVEIQVYLNEGLSDTELARLNKSLSAQAFTLTDAANNGVKFVSKEEAAKVFIDQTGEDFMEFLGDNPLRNAFVINIDPAYHTNDKMHDIKVSLEKTSGIFEVVYVENMIQSINENITKISVILLAVAAILFLVIIILINNTIKLALFSQRFLIRSMQLVGATNSFIRKPFIYRALWHGLLSGIFASILLYSLNYYAILHIDGLSLLLDPQIMYIIFGLLILLGTIIASMGTFKAVQKYLALSLEELY